jgi:hypothetical protein
MNIQEIYEFYQHSWKEGQRIMRLILDDKERFIRLKKEDPKWLELVDEMCIFNNQAMRMFSIMKYTFMPSISEASSLIGESKQSENLKVDSPISFETLFHQPSSKQN